MAAVSGAPVAPAPTEAGEDGAAPGAAGGRQPNRRVVTAALMLAMSLAALDVTVVGTAMPTIVGQLGGLALYGWVFSAYLLTSTTTVPIFGKLADIFGRKPVLLASTALFLLGSGLCGAAGSMVQLILFRAVQGLGAGGLQPVTMTIIGDIFPLPQRTRMQGFFSAVWGVSSVAGPALGGLLIDTLGWRWVFYVNVPAGLISMALILFALHERVERRAAPIDYRGTLLLALGTTALLLAVMQGQAWGAAPTAALLACALACGALFLREERRAPDPMLPLHLFHNPVIAVTSLAGFLVGGTMFGVTSFAPLYVQAVLGISATGAGLAIAPLSLGWPIGSVTGGRLILRLGFRFSSLLGVALVVVGSALLWLLADRCGIAGVVGSTFVIGLGMGFAMTSFVVSVQTAVAWRERGVATASGQFFRTIGGAVWVALMSTALNHALLATPAFAGKVSELLDPVARAAIGPQQLDGLRAALAAGLATVFLISLVVSVAALAATWLFPRGAAADLVPTTSPAAD